MEQAWVSVKERLPPEGEKIYYYSPILGLWIGQYKYEEFTHACWWDEDGNKHTEPVSEGLRKLVSPHVFYGPQGCCDTDEVTHWMFYDAQRAETWCPLPPGFTPDQTD